MMTTTEDNSWIMENSNLQKNIEKRLKGSIQAT